MESEDQKHSRQHPPITARITATQGPDTLQATAIVYWAHEVDVAIVELGGDPKDTAWNKWNVADIFKAAVLARELKATYGATVTITNKPRFVSASVRFSGRSTMSANASVIKVDDKHITLTDSGQGEDTVSATIQLPHIPSVAGVHAPAVTIAKRRERPGPKPATPTELMEIAWRLEQSGQTQVAFSETNTKGFTRYAVQQAAKYCAENPNIFRQFQAEKVLELERRKETRRQ